MSHDLLTNLKQDLEDHDKNICNQKHVGPRGMPSFLTSKPAKQQTLKSPKKQQKKY